MKKINIVVCGAGGRMGSLLLKLVSENENLCIKGAVEAKSHPLIGRKIYGIEVVDNLEKVLDGNEVVIDFTFPSATMKFLEIAEKKKSKIVIGTTGFSTKDMELIKKISEKIPVFLAPNMSFGVNIFFEIVRYATKLLKGYEIEITEVHHHFKKDAPSGTAKRIAEIICEVLGRNKDKVLKYGREGITGERSPEEIGIHSIRIGDIVGHHTVYYGGKGEIIEISHKCHNREAFASGAIRAAIFISDKEKGFYEMKHLIAEIGLSQEGGK